MEIRSASTMAPRITTLLWQRHASVHCSTGSIPTGDPTWSGGSQKDRQPTQTTTRGHKRDQSPLSLLATGTPRSCRDFYPSRNDKIHYKEISRPWAGSANLLCERQSSSGNIRIVD